MTTATVAFDEFHAQMIATRPEVISIAANKSLTFGSATSHRSRRGTFLGRCKKCRAGYRRDVIGFEIWRLNMAPWGMWVSETGERIVDGLNGPKVKCACGAHIDLKRLVGKFSEEHVCGARCMSATGPSCECSCGGKNHGRSLLG